MEKRKIATPSKADRLRRKAEMKTKGRRRDILLLLFFLLLVVIGSVAYSLYYYLVKGSPPPYSESHRHGRPKSFGEHFTHVVENNTK